MPGVRWTIDEVSKDDVRRPGVWAPEGCRCVSRNSDKILALLPFGPFFCGTALYVQFKFAARQFLQGFVPSLMHFTFLRCQLRHQICLISLLFLTKMDMITLAFTCCRYGDDLKEGAETRKKHHSLIACPFGWCRR